ncbi:hypothetical protein DESC_710061 [Desulfosarcina cetonica]|nr:hypothetical protein DESC_710061 [Desulfosarcina cetonica]
MGDDEVHGDKLGRHGGQNQIEALDPRRWQAEQHAPEAGHDGRRDDADRIGQAPLHHPGRPGKLQDQERAGIGPHGQKGRMPQGDLAAKPDQQLDTERPQNRVADLVAHAKLVGIREKRNDPEEKHCQEDHLAANEAGLPPGMILGIGFMVNPAGKPGCRHNDSVFD